MPNENLQLAYTILCDDVRLEAGNKLSLMGIFQNIMVEKLPVSLIKIAVINHWRGSGEYLTEVKILAPDKNELVVTSQPTQIFLNPNGGFSDNVSFFVNLVFQTSGVYWVQTFADGELVEELPLNVNEASEFGEFSPTEEISERIN